MTEEKLNYNHSSSRISQMANNDHGVIFIRELDVESAMTTVKIAQNSVGDVGSVVWDAGIVLAKYLDFLNSKGNSLKNKKVIELGSGTGVVGLFAAVLGSNVILTDLPELQWLLRMNIDLNKDIICGSATADVLKWGESFSAPQYPDIILIADCVYYEDAIDDLLKTISELKGENTELLISFEERTSANKKILVERFLDKLKQSFEVTNISASNQHPHYQSSDIKILKCSNLKS